MNLKFNNMNLKKSIVTLSLLFLALNIFTSCETSEIEDEQGYNLETQSTDKDDVGTIGNSGGDDDDEDYN